MTRKRIDWTEFEMDSVVRGTKELLGVERVSMPVQNPWRKGGPLLQAVRKAQLALPENRRRDIASKDSIAGILPKLVATGVLERVTVEESGKKVDPNEIRINQLADERDAAIQARDEQATIVRQLTRENADLRRELQSVPTEANVVKNFIADILYLWDAKKRAVPGASHLPEVSAPPKSQEEPRPPKHQSEPRQEGPRKCRIAIVGGAEHMFGAVERELENEPADLRHFDLRAGGGSIGDRLKAFRNPDHGVVILWENYTQHGARESLNSSNIPYVKYFGERGGLISMIRNLCKERTQSASPVRALT